MFEQFYINQNVVYNIVGYIEIKWKMVCYFKGKFDFL